MRSVLLLSLLSLLILNDRPVPSVRRVGVCAGDDNTLHNAPVRCPECVARLDRLGYVRLKRQRHHAPPTTPTGRAGFCGVTPHGTDIENR